MQYLLRNNHKTFSLCEIIQVFFTTLDKEIKMWFILLFLSVINIFWDSSEYEIFVSLLITYYSQ